MDASRTPEPAPEPMDHVTIERDAVVERYLLGQLAADEEVRFEEHLLGCGRCLEALDEAEDLRRSLRAAAADEIARTAVRAGILGWLRRHGQVAALVLLAVPLVYFWWQNHQLREPRVGGTAVTLSASRAGPGGGAPVDQIPRPAEGQLVLTVQLALVEHEEYDLTLEDAAGHRLWSRQGVSPDGQGSFTVGFPVSLLPPGDYALALSAPAADGRPVPAGRHPFRILPAP